MFSNHTLPGVVRSKIEDAVGDAQRTPPRSGFFHMGSFRGRSALFRITPGFIWYSETIDIPPLDPLVSLYLWTFGRSPSSLRVPYRANRLGKLKAQSQTWLTTPPILTSRIYFRSRTLKVPLGTRVPVGSYTYRRRTPGDDKMADRMKKNTLIFVTFSGGTKQTNFFCTIGGRVAHDFRAPSRPFDPSLSTR